MLTCLTSWCPWRHLGTFGHSFQKPKKRGNPASMREGSHGEVVSQLWAKLHCLPLPGCRGSQCVTAVTHYASSEASYGDSVCCMLVASTSFACLTSLTCSTVTAPLTWHIPRHVEKNKNKRGDTTLRVWFGLSSSHGRGYHTHQLS